MVYTLDPQIARKWQPIERVVKGILLHRPAPWLEYPVRHGGVRRVGLPVSKQCVKVARPPKHNLRHTNFVLTTLYDIVHVWISSCARSVGYRLYSKVSTPLSALFLVRGRT